MARFKRLLITGAAGNLGRELRTGLAPLAEVVRLHQHHEMDIFAIAAVLERER